MKLVLIITIFFGAILSVKSVKAHNLMISQLQCSGLGPVNGYTTIKLMPNNKVSISSTKFFVTVADENVSITNGQLTNLGHIMLSLYSARFNSTFTLFLSGPSAPAQFMTAAGTDVLNCASRIQGHL